MDDKTAYQRGYCDENESDYIGTQLYDDWCRGYVASHKDKPPQETTAGHRPMNEYC